MTRASRWMTRFFETVTEYPRAVLAIGMIVTIGLAAFIPTLVKDTTSDAYMPPAHPALLYRDKVKKIFGLKDPMVIAIVNTGEHGVFTPHTLALVRSLTEQIEQVEGIDPDRVISLATEKDITGTADGMLVEPFFDTLPQSQAAADQVRENVFDFPLYLGSLVARDGTATLIVAEILDDRHANKIYERLLEVAANAPVDTEVIHVAGEAAVAGYLSAYIDADASRLNPIAALIITLTLFAAYRTVRAAFLPNLIVLATLASAIGVMAASGTPFYVITNGLVVILIGISVADSIHILGEFYTEFALAPNAPPRQIVVRAMTKIWRPVTLTTLTTIAGFAGIYLASFMPPMKAFGLFAMLGVGVALVFSFTVLPAGLVLARPRPSPAFRAAARQGEINPNSSPGGLSLDRFAAAMSALGTWVYLRSGVVLTVAAGVVIAGIAGASRLQVNEARIENFKHSEPLYIADGEINRRMDGTNNLDIVIETDRTEALFLPANLRRIEALQSFAETLPHVKGSTSIVDYLKQMNRAVNEDQKAAYVVPDEANLVAQYFLLYSATGDPTDFEEEIDYDYQIANIRVVMDSGLFTDERPVILALENYIRDTFNGPGIRASLSGRVNVDYHWLSSLSQSHFLSVGVALVLVWLMGVISFRSTVAASLAVIPVALAVLLIYAVMGFAGIWLAVGTSMFAAIAIGLGIDFAIHTLDRMTTLIREEGRPLEQAVTLLFPSTGRALLFNALALIFGFGVLVTSSVPPLIRFGLLTAIAVSAAFFASLTVLPALVKVLRPRFLFGGASASMPSKTADGARRTLLILVLAAGGTMVDLPASAQSPAADGVRALPSGLEIAKHVNARDEGEAVSRSLVMKMTDRRGKTRVRETTSFRKYYGDEKRTVIFYRKPKNVKDTAFLTFDYPDPARDDDQWLYLPAMRKVRRISASDRGDYFLGTDFTYEDIKKETKVSLDDYAYKTVGEDEVDGHHTYVVEAIPVTTEVAKELGYSRVVSWVDSDIWIGRKSDYWDVAGNPLKTTHIQNIEQIQGIWTARRIMIENHKTGHRTVFLFDDINYRDGVADTLFTERALRRGR